MLGYDNPEHIFVDRRGITLKLATIAEELFDYEPTY